MLLPHLDAFRAREDDPAHLVAPWDPDPLAWARIEYLDPASGESFRIGMRGRTGTHRDWQRGSGTVLAESMRSYLTKHFTHPEPAATGSEGKPCKRDSTGVLAPIPVRIDHQTVVGKETNRLEQQRVGWRSKAEERQVFAAEDEFRSRVLAILGEMSERQLRKHGLAPRTVRDVRRGVLPTNRTRGRLERAATAYARAFLRAGGLPVPSTPQAIRSAFLAAKDTRSCQGSSCSRPLRGRQRKWCSNACRMRASRDSVR